MFRGQWLPMLFGLVLVSVLPVLSGCRNVDTLRQKCLTGDTGSCEGACRKGVAGEGGCFHAGQQLREKAANDYAGTDFRKASDFFNKSCEGNYGDGCLFAAQSLEAPYAALEPGDDGALPAMMPDSTVKLREQRLGRACALGSTNGCKRLGDVLIGKKAAEATAAYEKACALGAAPAECKVARKNEVDTAEKLRVDCTHRVADACTGLGNLLYAADPPRAIRLFATECELRGVAELSHGIGAFIRGRAREASKGIALPQAPRAVPPPPGALPVEIHAVRVEGELALVQVDRALGARQDDLTTCFAGIAPASRLELSGSLVVDRTGDVYRAALPGDRIPADVIGCATDVLESIVTSELKHGPATVGVSLTRAAAAPVTKPPKK